MDEQDDHVVEDAERLRVVGGDELVERLDQRLGAEHFAGVQAAVDPDDGLALGGQLAGLGLVDALGQREPAGDVPVVVELVVVGRRRDDAQRAAAGPPRSCRSRRP